MNGDGLDALTEVACYIGCPPGPCDNVVIMKNAGRISAVGADVAEGDCNIGRWCAIVACSCRSCARRGIVILAVNSNIAGQAITGFVTS